MALSKRKSEVRVLRVYHRDEIDAMPLLERIALIKGLTAKQLREVMSDVSDCHANLIRYILFTSGLTHADNRELRHNYLATLSPQHREILRRKDFSMRLSIDAVFHALGNRLPPLSAAEIEYAATHPRPTHIRGTRQFGAGIDRWF